MQGVCPGVTPSASPKSSSLLKESLTTVSGLLLAWVLSSFFIDHGLYAERSALYVLGRREREKRVLRRSRY